MAPSVAVAGIFGLWCVGMIVLGVIWFVTLPRAAPATIGPLPWGPNSYPGTGWHVGDATSHSARPGAGNACTAARPSPNTTRSPATRRSDRAAVWGRGSVTKSGADLGPARTGSVTAGRSSVMRRPKVGPPPGQAGGGLLTFRYWSGRRDSNPRPPVPQTGALRAQTGHVRPNQASVSVQGVRPVRGRPLRLWSELWSTEGRSRHAREQYRASPRIAWNGCPHPRM